MKYSRVFEMSKSANYDKIICIHSVAGSIWGEVHVYSRTQIWLQTHLCLETFDKTTNTNLSHQGQSCTFFDFSLKTVLWNNHEHVDNEKLNNELENNPQTSDDWVHPFILSRSKCWIKSSSWKIALKEFESRLIETKTWNCCFTVPTNLRQPSFSVDSRLCFFMLEIWKDKLPKNRNS